MKKLITLMLVAALAGCATLGLPDNPTPEQIQQAACADAQSAIRLAAIWLPLATGANLQYWQQWMAGAKQSAVDLGCTDVVVPTQPIAP